MRTKHVKLIGTMPLLMHAENLVFETKLKNWRLNPENKKKTQAGDDRTPGWIWIGYLYHLGDRVGMPSDNLMACFRDGGVKVPTGKGKETFKRLSQSGLLVMEPMWELTTAKGNKLSFNEISKLMEVDDFDKHLDAVAALDFELFVKRVVIGKNKWVRVRPIFRSGWSIEGDITISEDRITDQAFKDILEYAGRLCGLCDWRPGSPNSPGAFGMFKVEID